MNLFSRSEPVARVAFNTRPLPGPYGGANQWVTQLTRYLEHCGYEVRYDLRKPVECLMLTHQGTSGRLLFSAAEIRAYRSTHPRVRVIQRINDNDRRKGTAEMNQLLAETNAVTDHTVFVSEWLRGHHAGLWFDGKKPSSVILNGADPAAFHPIGGSVYDGRGPLRLVTHHWSDNWNKGFKVYEQIDAMIANGRLPNTALRIIGRWPAEIRWRAAETFGPHSGAPLARLLRECHVLVSASLWEPGAMHPVEGIQCGLPLLYHEDSGGTVELGQKFGISFREDIVGAIEQIRQRYQELRTRAVSEPPSGDLMCLEYRRLIQRCIAL